MWKGGGCELGAVLVGSWDKEVGLYSGRNNHLARRGGGGVYYSIILTILKGPLEILVATICLQNDIFTPRISTQLYHPTHPKVIYLSKFKMARKPPRWHCLFESYLLVYKSDSISSTKHVMYNRLGS